MSTATSVSNQNFESEVVQSATPVLVDFWAPWCGPCRAMAPAFVKAAGTLAPAVRLAKVNTEEATSLAQRFGIRSIPTLVLFKDGAELARISGALNHDQLIGWVRQHL